MRHVASKLRKLQQFQKWQKMGQKSPISEHKTPKTREIMDIFKKSFKPELRMADYTILPNFSLIGAFLRIWRGGGGGKCIRDPRVDRVKVTKFQAISKMHFGVTLKRKKCR